MVRPGIALVVVGVLGVSLLRAAEGPSVSYRDDRLTVRATNASLDDVLSELQRQTGATIRGDIPGEPVTATFDAVPLREALQRLLGDRSFTLVYAVDGRLKTIELKGGPGVRKPPVEKKPAGSVLAAASKKAQLEAMAKIFENRPPVSVDGKLAEATGTSEVPWNELLQTATSHENAAVRAYAFQAGMRAIDQNADIRDAMLKVLTPLTDEELAGLARAMTGEGALAAARYALQNTQTPALRERLRAALRELKRPAPLHASGG
jgi:hypothetical protein